MGHTQWPAACGPSYLCGALLTVAVLNFLGSASPLDLATKEPKSCSTIFDVEGFQMAEVASEAGMGR